MKRPLHRHEQTLCVLGSPPGQAHTWVIRLLLQVKPCQPRNAQTRPDTPGDRQEVQVQHQHRSSAFDESCLWVLEKRRGAVPGIPRITSCREKMQFNIHKSTFGKAALPPVSLPRFPATTAARSRRPHRLGLAGAVAAARAPPGSHLAQRLGPWGAPGVPPYFIFPSPVFIFSRVLDLHSADSFSNAHLAA